MRKVGSFFFFLLSFFLFSFFFFLLLGRIQRTFLPRLSRVPPCPDPKAPIQTGAISRYFSNALVAFSNASLHSHICLFLKGPCCMDPALAHCPLKMSVLLRVFLLALSSVPYAQTLQDGGCQGGHDQPQCPPSSPDQSSSWLSLLPED